MHLGTTISVFGTILSETQSTSLYRLDGDRERVLTAPQVSQDMHRALLYNQRNLRNNEHTLTVSFANSTAPPLDGTSCFSVDFMMYRDTSDTLSQTSSTTNQRNATSGDSDFRIDVQRPMFADRSSLIVAISLVTFIVLQLAIILILFRWHKRTFVVAHKPKDVENHLPPIPPPIYKSPISHPEATTQFSSAQGVQLECPGLSHTPTISAAPATVYSSADGRLGASQGTEHTLPSHPTSHNKDSLRYNLRWKRTGRDMVEAESLRTRSLRCEDGSENARPPSYA